MHAYKNSQSPTFLLERVEDWELVTLGPIQKIYSTLS